MINNKELNGFLFLQKDCSKYIDKICHWKKKQWKSIGLFIHSCNIFQGQGNVLGRKNTQKAQLMTKHVIHRNMFFKRY